MLCMRACIYVHCYTYIYIYMVRVGASLRPRRGQSTCWCCTVAMMGYDMIALKVEQRNKQLIAASLLKHRTR